MTDSDEISELTADKLNIRKKIIDGVSVNEEDEFYKEIAIINKRLMKLRDRN